MPACTPVQELTRPDCAMPKQMNGVMSGIMADLLIRIEYDCAITLEYLQEHARIAYQCTRNARLLVASFGLRENVLECEPVFSSGSRARAAEVDQCVKAWFSRLVDMPVSFQVRPPAKRLIDEFLPSLC